ncbi:MAG: glycosyltransferase family 4 protein [Candidatus Latescibacterota bacterium]|nr:MAG: glycosyltransferase family 4 protein [Candidatus Latescibacterota bacterium]RKY73563.1 MAG: glycosyltransferase family 4 protein [Candidatus Latescibacterota bacterium]
MDIAIFTDTFTPQINGIVTSINIFRKELTDMGHNVYVVAPKVTGYNDKADNIVRYFSISYMFQPQYKIAFPYSLTVPKLSDLKLDIIHAQTPFSMGLLALYLAKKSRVPLVYTHHTFFDGYVHYIPLNRKLLQKLSVLGSRTYCNHCTLVLTPSHPMRDLLMEYGVKEKIVVLPTGIDLESFTNNKLDNNIRQRYGISKSTKLLLYAGRIGEEKNLDFLLKSFRIVANRISDVHLLLVGDGPLKYQLIDLAKELDIASQLSFTGYLPRSEVISCCASADLFVFSSMTETQGLVLLEAMAAGTPVVAVDALGVSALIKNGQGGCLCEPSTEIFANRVYELLSSDSLRKQKAAQAKLRAEEFSSAKMAKRLVCCYSEARALFKSKASGSFQ